MAKRTFPFLVALLLGGAAAMVASRMAVSHQRPYDLTAVPGAAAARWTSLGHPTLVANLWWLRCVQYMGDERADERGWEKLYPAVDLVTDLDPRHGYAYQVAGTMLGIAERVAESNALFEKGHRNVPDRYILPFQRAVNAFLYEGDYAEAGRWFDVASRVPGAPVARMRNYAAAMLVKANAHDAARALLLETLAAAEDEATRRSIRKQLDQVELERRAVAIEDAAAVFAARNGFFPPALPQLVLEGYLSELPEDPFGGTLYLDAEGRVRSTANDTRYQRPLTSTARDDHLRELKSRTRQAEGIIR